MAKLSTDALLDAFKEMTLIELSEFVKQFEETFDVKAAAPVAVAAGPAGGAAAAEARRSRTSSTSSSRATVAQSNLVFAAFTGSVTYIVARPLGLQQTEEPLAPVRCLTTIFFPIWTTLFPHWNVSRRQVPHDPLIRPAAPICSWRRVNCRPSADAFVRQAAPRPKSYGNASFCSSPTLRRLGTLHPNPRPGPTSDSSAPPRRAISYPAGTSCSSRSAKTAWARSGLPSRRCPSSAF